MPSLESVIVSSNKTGAAIPGALVSIWDQGGRSDARVTDGSGFCNFGHWESEGITMSVQAAGFAQCNFYKIDDVTPAKIVMEPSLVPFDVAEQGFVHSVGNWWYHEDGSPFFLAGLTTHTLLVNIVRGDDLSWLFNEMNRLGANTLQVIGTHLSQWKQDNGVYYDPRKTDHVANCARLFDLAAQHKKRVLINALADCQNVSLSDKQRIWDWTIQAAAGRWNAMLGKGNEDGVNGWHIDDLRNPSDAELRGVPCSQGNNGGGTSPPHQPFLHFVQWECRPDPRKKTFDDGGSGAWEMYEGYGISNVVNFPPLPVPAVVGETAICNEVNPDEYGDFRWTNPADYLVHGLNTGANFAGGFVGSTRSLIGTPSGPIATQCLEAFYRGFWRAAIR